MSQEVRDGKEDMQRQLELYSFFGDLEWITNNPCYNIPAVPEIMKKYNPSKPWLIAPIIPALDKEGNPMRNMVAVHRIKPKDMGNEDLNKIRDDALRSIYKKWCKACGICVELCPKKVFDTDRDGYPVVARGLDCTQCSICWIHCPDFAITSKEI